MDEIHDTDGRLEPPEPEKPPADIPWGGIVATVGLILVVVFAVQNTEVVTVKFLWMDAEFALSIVILVTTLAAGIISAVATAFLRKRRRKRRAEKDELKTFRSQG